MTPNKFEAAFRKKGWRLQELAARWKISRAWLHEIKANPDRAPHYNDAVLGLPRKKLTPIRRPNRKRGQGRAEPRRLQQIPGYRYRDWVKVGTALVVVKDIGGDLDEGLRGIVVQVIDAIGSEKYRILFANGAHDIFSPDDIDAMLAETGETANEGYVFTDEAALDNDYADGFFAF